MSVVIHNGIDCRVSYLITALHVLKRFPIVNIIISIIILCFIFFSFCLFLFLIFSFSLLITVVSTNDKQPILHSLIVIIE